jgi:hypothetical protein
VAANIPHPGITMEQEIPKPRILLFSQRNAARTLPFRCAHFEFEDVIAEVDSAQMLAPRFDQSTRRHHYAKQLAYHTPLALNPGIERKNFADTYELFVAVCGDPTDMLRINAIGNWRERCKKAVIVIDELWITQMKAYGNYLRMLKQFDLVCLYYSQSPGPLNERIGPRSMYLPPAVDAIRFCPYPDPPARVVDVYSIGRRSAATHQALLKLAANRGLYYMYDSTSADQVLNPTDHRELYANTLKRSRYFIVNPGLIDRPDIRGDQIEIGYRYFDGVAAGAINVGERPNNEVFPKLFDWPDPMIDFPYNSADFDKMISRVENDPEKEDQMRRTNVRQALLRHDWVYRWETILKAAGLEPLQQMVGRKTRLRNLADLAAGNQARQTATAPEEKAAQHAVPSVNN